MLEVYEFIRAAGVSQGIGVQAANPDIGSTDRNSINEGSSLTTAAYSRILSSLIVKYPLPHIVHILPDRVETWSPHAIYKQNMFDWCNQEPNNKNQLLTAKYICLHYGNQHFCSFILDCEKWKSGPSSIQTQDIGARPCRASSSSFRRKSQHPLFIHMDTCPGSCCFLEQEEVPMFLTSICISLNKLFNTNWPVDDCSVRSYVQLAGPPPQEDEWSCGYHLISAWLLLYQQWTAHTADTETSTSFSITSEQVNRTCDEMNQETDYLVSLVRSLYDASTSTGVSDLDVEGLLAYSA